MYLERFILAYPASDGNNDEVRGKQLKYGCSALVACHEMTDLFRLLIF